jgi:hypothetical protein
LLLAAGQVEGPLKAGCSGSPTTNPEGPPLNAPDRIEELLTATRESFAEGALVQLKLGGYHGDRAGTEGGSGQEDRDQGGEKYSFTWRYKTRDTIKNYAEDEAMDAAARWPSKREFRSAQLATTGFDMMFERNGAKMRLKRTEVEGREAPSTEHNRAKNRPLDRDRKAMADGAGACRQERRYPP